MPYPQKARKKIPLLWATPLSKAVVKSSKQKSLGAVPVWLPDIIV